MKLASTIGNNARAAREELGLTQSQVAEEVGIPCSLYERIERGRALPSMPVFAYMARALKIDLLSGIALHDKKPHHHEMDSEVQRLITRMRHMNPGTMFLVRELMKELENLDESDEEP